MKTMLVSGYSSFELGIFDEKDVKIEVIKKAIRNRLIGYIENGLEWLIFTGNMGFEYWTLQVAGQLIKEGYELSLSTIFIFKSQGKNWNEANQAKLAQFKNVDYVKYAYEDYENPGQFRAYNEFLLENSDSAFIFYDDENETRLKFLVEKVREQENYQYDFIDFEDLQEVAESMRED